MSAALNVSAPTTRAEAIALVRRAARWHAGTVDSRGCLLTEGTRFTRASCASLEAMLTANGWSFESKDFWHGDASQRFVSTRCCWRHADPFADLSTFVRAVRCTIEGLAGVRPFDGISALDAECAEVAALTLAGWTLDTAVEGHVEGWRDPMSGRSYPRPYALRRVRADAESERAAAQAAGERAAGEMAGCGGAQ